MPEQTVLSVAQYLDAVNAALREDVPRDVAVEGEVSEYKVSQGKWVRFTLKDEQADAIMKCFGTAWKLREPLEDGMRVRVSGYPKVYERFGSFSLNAEEVTPVGEGALRRSYELLKKRLADEGVFDPSHKRAIPRFVRKIGLITSREAAAYGDFLRILNNRWGGIEVLHAHAHVQGAQAVPEILGAFAAMNGLPAAERPDVLVLVRGGGGLEDLHAFNDESVARAVFQSKVPVVVGVGHERDESLADYAADIRASTPSNAAERIVPNREEIGYELEMMAGRIESRLEDEVAERHRAVDLLARAIAGMVERQQERLANLREALIYRADNWLPRIRHRLEAHERFLSQVDPKRVLARGYSLVTVNGKVVRDAKDLGVGAQIGVQLARGHADAQVTRVNGKGQQKLV